jgi:hypothetical protein
MSRNMFTDQNSTDRESDPLLFGDCFSSVIRLLFPRRSHPTWLMAAGAFGRNKNREISPSELLEVKFPPSAQWLVRSREPAFCATAGACSRRKLELRKRALGLSRATLEEGPP